MDKGATRDARAPRSWAGVPLARVGIVALLVLALLVVVALASSASGTLGGDRGTTRGPSRTFVDYVFTIMLFVVVGSMAATAWMLRPSGRWRETDQRTPSNIVPLFIALIVVVAAAFGIAYLVRGNLEPRGRTLSAESVSGTPSGTASTTATPAAPYEPEFRWPIAVAAAALIVAVLVAGAIARSKRRKLLVSTPAEFVAELTSLIDIALDDLRAELDPRRAVIAAYARMERALGSFGLGRRAFEAPFEYLGRIAPALDEQIPPARPLVAALTELFERAKFSSHEVDVSMKNEAIDTLTALRDDLVARRAEQEPAVV